MALTATNALAQDALPALWRRGWRISAGGGGQIIWKARPAEYALVLPLIQFPGSGAVARVGSLEWFWNRRWGAVFYFNYSHTNRLSQADFERALQARYPGRLFSYPSPDFYPEYFSSEVLQVLFGIKHNQILSRRWCWQTGLSIGGTEMFQYARNVDVKVPGEHTLQNVWVTPDSSDLRPGPEPFTLTVNNTAVYLLSRRWHVFAQLEYAWIQPDLKWEIVTLDQVTGEFTRESLRYRRALHQLNLTFGLAFRL